MDKINHYREIILDILEEYVAYKPVNVDELDQQIIADMQRNHFQLVSIGWAKDRFLHDTIFHFDIKPNGKIWIQANGTDTDIAAKLVSCGVPPHDIVLGFQLPRYRRFTGYAEA